MSNYLFLFTIGPVQSFIAQARKTQDLYAGSKLLSDLIGYGLQQTIELFCAKSIFPSVNENQNLKDERSYPNRFLVSLDAKQYTTDEIGEKIERIVKEKLVTIAKEYIPEYETISGIKEQIEDFLQVYWVIIPFEKDNEIENYQKTFTKIERYLGAIKNVRTFKQLNYQIINTENIIGEVGRKCSLNGEYNVKFYRLTESDKKSATRRILNEENNQSYSPSFDEIKTDISKNKLFIEDENEVHILDYNEENPVNHVNPVQRNITKSQLQPGEGLSAISMLKRLYEGEIFPSTAGICLLHKLLEWRNSDNNNYRLIDCYENLLKNKNAAGYFDEQLYFAENATSEKYLKGIGINNPEIINSIIKYYKENIKELIDNEKEKYYAILTFDGDSMGKWLSGEFLHDSQDSQDLQKVNLENPVNPVQNDPLYLFHQQLSKALGDFAQFAKQYIDNQNGYKHAKGRTVYAGGDDFLAFINLNHLFDVMRTLREEFKIQVSDKLEKFKKDKKQELTFSAGIAIAHYKIPLSIVLKEARKMQDHAKDLEGKDAFAITVLKHSGETPSTRMKWNGCKTTNMASKLIGYLLDEKTKMSDKFIYDFHREFSRLMDNNGKITELQNDDLIKVELSRLAQRKVKLEKEEDKVKFRTFIDKLFSLYSDAPKETENDLINFINLLYICSFVSRHINKDNFRQDLQDEQDKDFTPIEENK